MGNFRISPEPIQNLFPSSPVIRYVTFRAIVKAQRIRWVYEWEVQIVSFEMSLCLSKSDKNWAREKLAKLLDLELRGDQILAKSN